MELLAQMKTEGEDFEVEYEVTPIVEFSKPMDERQKKIFEGEASVDEMLAENQRVVDELNLKIDSLTNHGDKLDYIVAACSGIVAGIMDVLFVDDFSIGNANTMGNDLINETVLKAAKTQGYKGDNLADAVGFLEKRFPIAADKATNDFGGGLQHHLRDFSHHPTPIGLFFSILTQFTKNVYGTDTAGIFKIVPLGKDGINLVGKDVPEKITLGVINWWFHMLSDIAGSSTSIANGKLGTGLPGPIVSLLKEMSALPIFRNTNEQGYKEFSVWISKLFNGTLLGERDANGKVIVPAKFDLRTEVGFGNLLKEQAKPVIFNECIVRGFYFIRRLCVEIKDFEIKSVKELSKLNWKNILPFKNRTIVRMLTISTGTMVAIDAAVAAGESAIKSGGVGPLFLSNMIVKINYVGLGRFAIAVGTEAKMEIDRAKLRNKRMAVMTEQIFLLNSKTFYKQAQMWIAAENAGESIEEAHKMIDSTAKIFSESYMDIKQNMKKIDEYIPKIEERNRGLLENIEDIIKFY